MDGAMSETALHVRVKTICENLKGYIIGKQIRLEKKYLNKYFIKEYYKDNVPTHAIFKVVQVVPILEKNKVVWHVNHKDKRGYMEHIYSTKIRGWKEVPYLKALLLLEGEEIL